MTALTRAAAFGLAVLAAYAAVVVTVPARAGAATSYRYWAYYVAHGSSWQYSQRGPATEHPADGEVQGWRFAIQADAANELVPRTTPDFTTLCKSTPAKADEQRVGIVIDFGLASEEPVHEQPPASVVPGCIYVHDGETGADVLAAAAAVRIGTGSDAGLVCGIDGYPNTECAVAVDLHAAATPSVAATPSAAAAPSTKAATITHPATTPAPGSSAGRATPAVPAQTSAAAPPSAPAPAPAPAPASAPAPSFPPAPAQSSAPAQSAAASALSLGALRSSSQRHGHGIPASTLAGIALIVVLGAGALWRTRARTR